MIAVRLWHSGAFRTENFSEISIETMLRLVEMHGLYPLFVMQCAQTPRIEGGRVCTLSWRWVDEDVSATVVFESRIGDGMFFRIPHAKDFEGVRGITGPVLAACLFAKSEASVVVTDVRVSPLELCAVLREEGLTFKEGLLSCSSIW